MAYLRDIEVVLCVRCDRRAVVELVNRYNALHGRYCRTHGEAERRRLEKAEADNPRQPSNY